jgi:predicted ArsR family transcriptional regulator
VTQPESTASSSVAGPRASGSLLEGHPTSGPAGLSQHQVLASVSRMAILELLRSSARPLGAGEIAQHIGLHQNTVRFHLDLLVDFGYAVRRREAPSGPGRPRVIYESTAAPEGEGSYRLLAQVLAQHLASNSERPVEDAVEAGRAWAGSARRRPSGEGSEAATAPPVGEDVAISEVVRMLADIGFAPELGADGTSIYLHRCPFRALAESHSGVVCGAHLGLIQGALAELGAPVSATRLLPFVEPDLCIATLDRPAGRFP